MPAPTTTMPTTSGVTIPSSAVTSPSTTGTSLSPLIVSTSAPAAQTISTINSNLNTITDTQAKAQLAREAQNMAQYGNGLGPQVPVGQVSNNSSLQAGFVQDSTGQIIKGSVAPTSSSNPPLVTGTIGANGNATINNPQGQAPTTPSYSQTPTITGTTDAQGRATINNTRVPTTPTAQTWANLDAAKQALGSDLTGVSQNPDGSFSLSQENADYRQKNNLQLPSAQTGSTFSNQTGGSFGQYSNALDALNQKTDSAFQSYQSQMQQIQNGTFPLTEDQSSLLSSIRDQFNSMTAQQQLVNQNYVQAVTQAGISSGRNRYAPEVELGNIQGAINLGVQKIAEINRQAIQTTLEAKAAMRKENYEMVNQSYDRLTKLIDDKKTEMMNMTKLAADHEDKIRDYNMKLMEFNQNVQDKQNDFALRLDQFDRQISQDNIANNLNISKFNYQQAQDEIDNALKTKQIDQAQANNLRDYNLKMEQLRQSKYIVSSDAYGRPIAFNTKTGQFENSALPSAPGSGGDGSSGDALNQPQNLPILDALQNASLGMDPKTKQQLMLEVNNLLGQGDISRVQDKLTRVALKNATADQQNAAVGRVQAIKALNDIQSLLNSYVQKTGDTGILKGNIESFYNKLGQTNDPTLKGLQSQILLAQQAYRSATTGKAFSESESAEYKKIFPDITDTAGLNNAKIGAAIRSFSEQQKGLLSSIFGGTNFDAVFPNPKSNNLLEWSQTYPERWGGAYQFIQQNNLNQEDALQFLNSLTSPPVQTPQPPEVGPVPTINSSSDFNKPLGTGVKGQGTSSTLAVPESNRIASKVIGGYDFTNYATDPNWGHSVKNIIAKIPDPSNVDDVGQYIAKVSPKSPFKDDPAVVVDVAKKAGIDPKLFLAIVQHESLLGTSSIARKNNNFSGITWNGKNGEKGSPRPASEGGYYVKFPSAESGLLALARNINKRAV